MLHDIGAFVVNLFVDSKSSSAKLLGEVKGGFGGWFWSGFGRGFGNWFWLISGMRKPGFWSDTPGFDWFSVVFELSRLAQQKVEF